MERILSDISPLLLLSPPPLEPVVFDEDVLPFETALDDELIEDALLPASGRPFPPVSALGFPLLSERDFPPISSVPAVASPRA